MTCWLMPLSSDRLGSDTYFVLQPERPELLALAKGLLINASQSVSLSEESEPETCQFVSYLQPEGLI